MRVIEDVGIVSEWDTWMGLEALSQYSGLSVSSLRAYLAESEHPLPHYRMKEPHVVVTKAGKQRAVSGKILIRKSEFDLWMQYFKHTPDMDVDRLVDEVVAEFRR